MNLPRSKGRDVVWHPSNITKHDRERLNGHFGATLWFTGLSASGKSTVAHEVEDQLYNREIRSYVLDGDNIRFGLNRDLGFAPEDRTENIRRIGEVCRLFQDAGLVVLTAFVSPYAADRQMVRELHPEGAFVEVFVDTPLEVCESRDVKGLYAKARAGEIQNFTGISAPYEAPEAPELRLMAHEQDIDACAQQVVDLLEARGFLHRD